MTATLTQAGLTTPPPTPPATDLTGLHFGWSDPSPKVPVVEKAQRAIDGFRLNHRCDPLYLRVNVVEAQQLAEAGFDEVEILACTYVGRHNFYAVRNP